MLEVTAYTGIEPGIHDINVTDCKTMTAKAGGEYLRWEFTRADGKTTSANSSVEMTPGNKTGKWFAALTGTPTIVGQTRSIGEVIGKAGTIVVELNAEGFTKVIALTGRQAKPAAHPPVIETITAAEKAEQQHALQEDGPQVLP
jgi:hypothetical protein